MCWLILTSGLWFELLERRANGKERPVRKPAPAQLNEMHTAPYLEEELAGCLCTVEQSDCPHHTPSRACPPLRRSAACRRMKQGVNPDASAINTRFLEASAGCGSKKNSPRLSQPPRSPGCTAGDRERSLQSSVAKALHQILTRSKAECPPRAHLSVSGPHTSSLTHSGCRAVGSSTATSPRLLRVAVMQAAQPTPGWRQGGLPQGLYPRADFLGDELAGLCRGPGPRDEPGSRR